MKEEHKKKVRKSVLNSKAQLEEDLSKQLKQYGIFPDRLVDVEKLDLTGEKKQKRKDLEEILEKIGHKDTGDKTEQEYYVRKAAYTYFNRLAALKLMESHSLLDNVITPNSEFGNQPELLFHYKDITDIQNEDTLYESYFTGIFDDLDQEIGKIFDMDDQTSLLFPSSNAVDTVIEELDNIPQQAWKEEEIIGWMYQYFISEEKDDAFDKLNNDNQKINGSTLPAVTSLYTPHWIVEYLVDNTLGVMWKEMHPDTEIEKICDYIVPDQEFEEREPKDIEEITLLDPACGSGHFLLYAFDVFYEMYKEEGYDEEEIPKKILENNLYGIDVDNRSSQLSALALYVKAKELTPDAAISQLNIISADAVLMNGEKKEKLLEKCRHDIEEEVIEEIWDNFQHLDERGSLVKIEEPVREKITEYKNNLSKEDKDQQLIHQFSDETRELQSSSGQQKLAESVSSEEYWDLIEEKMVQRVQELGQEAIQAQDMSEQLFATETEKTLHLLDYLMADYDIVATNPPYLVRTNMSPGLKNFIDTNYSESNSDLYSAFITRCIEFSNEFVGMITQESFLFVTSYEDLRKNLISNYPFSSLLHLGSHVFPELSGEKASTAAFTIRKGFGEETCFFQLDSTMEKKKTFERKIESPEKHLHNPMDAFRKIEGNPISYWASRKVLSYFDSAEKLTEIADPLSGMQTGNNPKYIRYHWEIPDSSIGFNDSYRPMIKGHGDKPRTFYDLYPHVVKWDIDSIRSEANSAIRNKERFGEKGLNSIKVGSSGHSARFMEEGFVFDSSRPPIIPKEEEDINYLNGFLNSDIIEYLMNILNPTLGFQVGDLERIPVLKPEEDTKEKIGKLSKSAYKLRKNELSKIEISRKYEKPGILDFEDNSLVDAAKKAIREEEKVKATIEEKNRRINQKMFDIYDVNDLDSDIGTEEIDLSDIKEDLVRLYEQGKEISWGNGTRTKEIDVDEIALELDISPEKTIEHIDDLDLYRDEDIEEKTKELLSYFIQVSLGRWEIEGVESTDDGILMVSTEVSSDSPSLMDKIRECIAAEWGQENVSDIESEINNILYHGMEKWIKKYFFKNFHYKMYNKRPVVWEIKTPNDHFKAFIYYHELDEDTLPKLQVDYIEPLMTEYNNRKNLAKENGNTAEAEKLEDKVEDLRKLKEQLDVVIEEGYSPDLDEGVKHNFKPVENMTLKEMK